MMPADRAVDGRLALPGLILTRSGGSGRCGSDGLLAVVRAPTE